MANPYTRIVASKLAYARALLRLEASQDNALVQAALSQGALLHLHGAWRAFLQEIAANYQLRAMDAVISARTLCHALSAEGKTPIEASELSDLEANPASWVAQMLQLVQQLDVLSPAVVAGTATSARAAEGLIAAGGEPAQTAVADAATVNRLLAAFVDLLERQRSTMIEC